MTTIQNIHNLMADIVEINVDELENIDDNITKLTSLRLKLAIEMAVNLSNEIALVDREFSAKYIEIKNARREAGYKTTNDEIEEARNETDVAQKKTELIKLWRGCELTLQALQQKIHWLQAVQEVRRKIDNNNHYDSLGDNTLQHYQQL